MISVSYYRFAIQYDTVIIIYHIFLDNDQPLLATLFIRCQMLTTLLQSYHNLVIKEIEKDSLNPYQIVP